MNVSKSEIEALEEWLGSRLGPLLAHGDKVRNLLQAADGPQRIIASAVDVVTAENPPALALSDQQLAVWKSLLPILAEHGLMTVRAGGVPLEQEKPFSKEEAAEFLGFSVSKLNRCMKKRQIEYEKYGTGKTATVRFNRAQLEKFRASRAVPARMQHS